MSHRRAPHVRVREHDHLYDPVNVLIVGLLVAVFLIVQAIAPQAL
ncbi:MAG: hypothetical protein JWM02_2926 [Frankiales bacterium]|nr:hypothetical protein [Frankiales bacterium]